MYNCSFHVLLGNSITYGKKPEGGPKKNLSGSVDMMTSENYTGFFYAPLFPCGLGLSHLS